MREVAVVTTGFFDGVHLGHRHVLETVVSSARERGEEAVVVTFWPHPRTVLQQDAREFRLLSSLEEKKALLAAAGIDRVEVLPFTRSFAALTAAEYLQLLQDRFGATLVVMGYDNRIGSDRMTAAQLGAVPCGAAGTQAATSVGPAGTQGTASAVGSADPSHPNGWAPPSYLAEGGQRPTQHPASLPALLLVGPLPSAMAVLSVKKADNTDTEAENGVVSVETARIADTEAENGVVSGKTAQIADTEAENGVVSVETAQIADTEAENGVVSGKTARIADTGAPRISSTVIRKALEAGDVEGANAMLGYYYGLYGVVVAGNRMGRTIGFPTANMQLYEPLKLVPCNGVYAVEVEVQGQCFRGMTNIGTRPTVGGTSRTIETHILDFNEDIYGLPLRIRFLRRIRDERKFPSLEALRQQLMEDRLRV